MRDTTSSLHTTHATVTVRRLDDAPEVAQVVSLRFEGHDGAPTVHGRDAVMAALTQALARGERVELTPRVESVSAVSDEAAGLRASASLRESLTRREPATASFDTPLDMHGLGLRLDRPASRSAPSVYAALLGVDEGALRGAEEGGVWRWYASDRTVRWAPQEGAPWALRWKATRSACQTPRELWERLVARSILPMDWVGGGGRLFGDPPARGERDRTDDVPLNIVAALALASDIDGVIRAEALMHEAAQALAPWGARSPSAVCWRVARDRSTRRSFEQRIEVVPDALFGLVERTEAATAPRKVFLAAFDRAADVHYSRSWVARALIELRLAWRLWCDEDRRVPARIDDWPPIDEAARWYFGRDSRTWKCPAGLAGRRVRDLADPTQPLLGIVSLGYRPGRISAAAATLHHRVR